MCLLPGCAALHAGTAGDCRCVQSSHATTDRGHAAVVLPDLPSPVCCPLRSLPVAPALPSTNLPTPQQDCPVGFGQCCSAAGQVLPAATNCTASEDPCTLQATCDGARVTCPERWAKNGTPCSPASLLGSPFYGRKHADGHNKTARCHSGQCGKHHHRHMGRGKKASKSA